MNPICFQPAYRQMEALNTGQISSVGLLKAHIEQFRAVNKRLNAIIRTDIDRALERANGLDLMRAEGKILGPLHGLPMTIKDTIDVDAMPAMAGAAQWSNRQKPVPDARVVERVKDAGAVIWGKTNAPFLAGDWQSYNDLFGQTTNPFDLSRTPGGSSGGAAAALAAGLTPLEIGSDIGGSLRIPAHFCGVASLKPTYGVIPQAGHVPPSPEYPGEVDLNVIGPMARTVKDLKLLRSVMMRGATGGDKRQVLRLDGKKLALWLDHDGWPLDREMGGLLDESVRDIASIGAEVTRAKPDFDLDELIDVYLSLLIPVVSMDSGAFKQSLKTSFREILKLGRAFEGSHFTALNWAIKSSQSHIDWMKADGRRARLKSHMRDFFRHYDALIMPVSPTPAFLHDTEDSQLSRTLLVNGRKEAYANNLTWNALATCCHLPAVTIPASQTQYGLPVGIQIVGAQGEDQKILDIAEACESIFIGFRKPKALLNTIDE